MNRLLLLTLSTLFFLLLPCMEGAARSEDNPGLLGISLPGNYRPFSDSSPWNTPIAKEPELEPFSRLMIDELAEKARYLKGSTTKWTVSLFVIDSEKSPKRDVKTTRKAFFRTVDPDADGVATGMPVPLGVWPDPTTDAYMAFVDLSANKTWDYTKVKILPDGNLLVSKADVWDLDGPGFRPPFDGDWWWMSGGRAPGMPLIAGLIRPEEIEAGEIRHALAFAGPTNMKSTFPGGPMQVCAPPASRTDGKGEGFQYLPQGIRLQLDPSLDLDTLGLSEPTKIVARAMQVYGMINSDGARDFKVYFQNLGPHGGKWTKYNFMKDLRKIPVSSFRAIKCNRVYMKRR